MSGENEVVDNADELAAFNASSEGLTETPAQHDEVKAEPEAPIEPAIEYAQITKAEYADLLAKAASVDKAFGKIGRIEQSLGQMQQPGGIEITDDDFSELRQEFPELAELQTKGLNKIFSKLKSGAPANIDQMVTERSDNLRRELVDAQLDEIVKGDWIAEVNSEKYVAWIGSQPNEVKALADSPSVRDASRLLRMYTATKSTPVQQVSSRKQQLAAAVTPRGTGGYENQHSSSEEDAFNAVFKRSG